jgi:hypothetical protein
LAFSSRSLFVSTLVATRLKVSFFFYQIVLVGFLYSNNFQLVFCVQIFKRISTHPNVKGKMSSQTSPTALAHPWRFIRGMTRGPMTLPRLLLILMRSQWESSATRRVRCFSFCWCWEPSGWAFPFSTLRKRTRTFFNFNFYQFER